MQILHNLGTLTPACFDRFKELSALGKENGYKLAARFCLFGAHA